MKTILLYANDDKGFEGRFRIGLDLAHAYGAHLRCVHVTPYDAFIMGDPFGGIYTLPALLDQVRGAESAHRSRVEERLRTETVGWDWSSYEGVPAQVVAAESSLCDLVLVSLATEPDGYDGPLSLAADVALHVRAPVLAVPSQARSLDRAAPMMVAWNGSREASQALRLAVPMLARATAVHIVTVAEGEPGAPASNAAAYLARHGIGSQFHHWPRDGRRTTQALIDAAEKLGVGCMVMGLYGHSRLREAVLGGVTREILRTSPLPLLLAH